MQARVLGDPMATWRRHMPEGMFLKSTPSASSISAPEPGFTLMDYCDHIGTPRLQEDQPVPIDLFERYGLWFQQQLVPWVEQERVCRVAPNGDGFHVALDDRRADDGRRGSGRHRIDELRPHPGGDRRQSQS